MLKNMRVQFNRLKDRRKAYFGSDQPGSREGVLSFYTRVIPKVTDAERCSIFINDPDKHQIWLKVGTGVKEAEIAVPTEGSVVGDVIKSGKTMIVTDLEHKKGAHKEVDQKTGFVTRNLLCVPIVSKSRNEVTGAFQILNKKNNQQFTAEDVALAEELAEHLQMEVDRIFLDQEMFHFTERLYATANRALTSLAVSFGGVVVVLLAVIVWRGLKLALAV